MVCRKTEAPSRVLHAEERTPMCASAWSIPVQESKKRIDEPLFRELITTSETARRLGVSLRTVQYLIDEGEIPIIRIRGRVAIDPRDIASFVEKHRVTRRRVSRGCSGLRTAKASRVQSSSRRGNCANGAGGVS